ncbi:MAG: dihydrolipoamide acetyltransferase family protein [Candidatus Peregrinibacteria bacterium]|nr:dihydrolipoamide acetyltransferase family protein [Candidatus Peregrinibacteria bacterium]
MLEFKFPDVGEGIHEGTIVKWRVKEGDEVKSDQVLVEIETDKAVVEIPSPRAGVIAKTFHAEKETIKVGDTLVVITDKGEAYDPSATSVATASTPATTTTSVPPPDKGPGVVGSIDASNKEIPAATPSARAEIPALNLSAQPKILPGTRNLALKLGVDLSMIKGSGTNGMITDADVMSASSIKPTSAAKTPSAPLPSKTFPGPVTITEYKGIRKAVGDHVHESHMHTVPVTHFDTLDITKLFNKRETEKAAAQAQNIKLTFLAYIVQAVTQTLKDFSMINSELNESTEEIVTKNYYNIGIAVDTEEGLLVPVIKDADKKDLYTIAQEIVSLAEKAKAKKLTLEEMSGGSFTITNYGSVGGDFATPVINYPQSAILGLGKIRDTLALDPANPTAAPHLIKTMGLSLTFDHRLIDGAVAARFVNALMLKLQ